MVFKIFILFLTLTLGTLSNYFGQSKTNAAMNSDNSTVNPLLCDTATGLCEIPNENKNLTQSNKQTTGEKSIKIIYYTDPICSSCWGIEPQLRKLKLAYGSQYDIEYRMGGLLKDWSYNSGGISQPSDVAHHWDEVSLYYQMPIDGDVWLEDPLSSSYPPSIAFKAAQLQDKEKANLFLRALKEMVFLEKKNITKWEHIESAAISCGLDTKQLKSNYEGAAKILFENDLKLAQESGVRGFPSIIIISTTGEQELVYGAQPYEVYERTILKLNPELKKSTYAKDWKSLFNLYNSLTRREFSELSGMSNESSEMTLNDLVAKSILTKLVTKNGAIWSLK